MLPVISHRLAAHGDLIDASVDRAACEAGRPEIITVELPDGNGLAVG